MILNRWYSLVLVLVLSFPALAQEVIVNYDNSTLPILNEELRKIRNKSVVGTRDYTSYVSDTVYLAESDLFVSAYSTIASVTQSTVIYVDTVTPPAHTADMVTFGNHGAHGGNVNAFVKKGEYWQVNVSGVGVTVTINTVAIK